VDQRAERNGFDRFRVIRRIARPIEAAQVRLRPVRAGVPGEVTSARFPVERRFRVSRFDYELELGGIRFHWRTDPAIGPGGWRAYRLYREPETAGGEALVELKTRGASRDDAFERDVERAALAAEAGLRAGLRVALRTDDAAFDPGSGAVHRARLLGYPALVEAEAAATITTFVNTTADAVDAVPRRPAVMVVRRYVSAAAEAETRALKFAPWTRAQKNELSGITAMPDPIGAKPSSWPALARAVVISIAW
jgi:hypothetical protein